MTANASLLLSNPDFASRLASLKAWMRSQDRFRDYDFDGANLSVLLNVLAYNSYQDAFLTSMAITESFKDTAQLKSSVISRAKEVGYVPRSMRSAGAYVDIEVVPTGTPATITLPKGHSFTTIVGTRQFTFSTDSNIVIFPNPNGRYLASNTRIYEGFYVSEVFEYDASVENPLFTLSNEGVDTRSLEVSVDGVSYNLGTTLVTLDSSSPVYFIQLGNDSKYQIYFGDNVLGVTPGHQAQILVRYRVATGSAPNSAREFSVSGPIDGHSNVIVTTVSNAIGGAEPEDIESIRRNSSLFYAARNRAVTAADYKVLLQQQFPEITGINVFGGEDMNPPEYGKVFISVDIEGADGAPDSALNEYASFIKNKSPVTIQQVFISPTFLELTLDIVVYYKYLDFAATETDISAAVKTAAMAYNDAELNKFNTVFKESLFTRRINECHVAIDPRTEVSVQMALVANSTILPTQTQKLYFDNALNTQLQSISSSTFSYNGLTCSIRDDQAGSLQIITDVQGAQPTVVTSIGTVNYTTGEVSINPIAYDSLSGRGLTIYAKSASKNIAAVKNTILFINSSGVNVRPVAIS